MGQPRKEVIENFYRRKEWEIHTVTLPARQGAIKKSGNRFRADEFYLIVEVIGGLWTGSLARRRCRTYADGRCRSQVGTFGDSGLPKTRYAERTYGYYCRNSGGSDQRRRADFDFALYFVWSLQALQNPPEVQSAAMLGVAAIGLVINIIGIYFTRRFRGKPQYEGRVFWSFVRYAHFNRRDYRRRNYADNRLVLRRSDHLGGHRFVYFAAHLGVTQRCRRRFNRRNSIGCWFDETARKFEKLKGVAGIHDLHVWSLTSGVNAMSVHGFSWRRGTRRRFGAGFTNTRRKISKSRTLPRRPNAAILVTHETHL